MELFNLQQAHNEEKTFLIEKNYKGLAATNIKICENLGSNIVFTSRLPKVGYYLGRLKALEEFKTFLERNNGYLEFFFFSNEDILKLTFDCFKYGYDYERLSSESKVEIRNYFSNPKYSELFSEMMFDYAEDIEEVKTYNFSSREIRNDSYSEFLVSQIGAIIISDDESMYYDRSKNEVIEIECYEDAIKGVHFPIDYTGITRKSLDSVIKLLIAKMEINEEGFENKFLYGVLESSAANASIYAFNEYYFNKIFDFLSSQSALIKIGSLELRRKILTIIAKDYLDFVNSK